MADPVVAQSLTGGGDESNRLEELVVVGRATDLVGSASTASEGSVGYRELDTRPFLRRGELLEVVPGVVITQHSGGGKANQYFLRGFNLDHGTDFSLSVDGMPVNMRSHAHGQGYADLNFLIPELVRSVDYSKGPFFARVGDFSAAGAAEFALFDELPAGIAKGEIGGDGYARAVLADTFAAKNGPITLGFETARNDGPWQLEENFRRFSGLGRRVWLRDDTRLAVTAVAYVATWDSTDQIPERAVAKGQLGRFGNIDATNGGETERLSLSMDWSARHANGGTHVNAYAIHYRLNLFSNFTYFLDDPVNGDQFNQRDQRIVLGGALTHDWTCEWFGKKVEISAGVQVRDDIISELGLHHTVARKRIGTTRNDEVNEGSAGIFSSARVKWNEWLRSEVGMRVDGYRFDVSSDTPRNSGSRTAGILSPKIGIVLGPWAKTEVYGNAGSGFHSNDARGTVISVDPSSGFPLERVSPLVRSKGAELGVRTSRVRGLVSTLSLWWLELDSELVFVGDAGGTEPSAATRRYGVEIANFYRVTPWLALDGDLSFTHGRYRDNGGADRIANSIDHVITGGVALDLQAGWFGSARLRYFGSQPLIENNSVRAPSSTAVQARLGWRGRTWEVALDVLNVLGRNNNDIAYFYESKLTGEAEDGVDDVHFHPAEPRTIRVSVTRRF